jgi:hypothetical protein
MTIPDVDGKLISGLEQVHKYWEIKPVNGIPTVSALVISRTLVAKE